jgi:hypothetical protein
MPSPAEKLAGAVCSSGTSRARRGGGTAGAEGWELVGAFLTERESQTDAVTVPHSACYAAEPGSLPGIVCIDHSR